MIVVRHLILSFTLLLLAASGVSAAFAAPGDWSRVSYPLSGHSLTVQSLDLAFTARAHPPTSKKVAATGNAVAQTGGLHPLDGVGTRVAALAFDGGFLATNRVPVPENLGKNIHTGAQDKHIPGTNNYDPTKGRSILTADPTELLDGVHSGKYPVVRMAGDKPIVDFGKPIGTYGDNGPQTQFGTIHSGKNGVHIVPANPTQY